MQPRALVVEMLEAPRSWGCLTFMVLLLLMKGDVECWKEKKI